MRNNGTVKEAWGDIRNEVTSRSSINNIPLQVKTMLKDLKAEELARQAVDREVGVRFTAWFHDWAETLRKLIGNLSPHENRQRMKIDWFLGQIDHHFTDSHSPQRVRNAFRYLSRFFTQYPSVAARHTATAYEMLKRLCEARDPDVQGEGEDVRGWFHNRMTVVIMSIENPRLKDFGSMMEIAFFLEALEQYFVGPCGSGYYRNAFRYLGCYFRIYPCVRRRQSEKALEMIGRIYQAMGYEFRHQPYLKPSLMDIYDESKRCLGDCVYAANGSLVNSVASLTGANR